MSPLFCVLKAPAVTVHRPGQVGSWQAAVAAWRCRPPSAPARRSLVVWAGGAAVAASSKGQPLSIIHFNDVYNIDARGDEPVGGAARMAHAIKQLQHERPLVLFSGDCLNPSLMSAFTLGEQMVGVLNALGVQASVVGNHDCDFGTEVLRKHMRSFRFPWLLSNVLDARTGEPLAGAKRWHMLEWQGLKIGLMGLVEREWLVTIPSLDETDIEFLDFCEEGRRLAGLLREQGADLVIALTHMRAPNDMLLAAQVPEVQLILAGHDHHFAIDRSEPHGTWVVKSGTDFREFSVLRFEVPASPEQRPEVQWERVEVNSQVPEDPEVAAIVKHYQALIGTKMDEPLGYTHVDLDARFDTVRTSESNLGSLFADIMRTSLQADAAFFNGGTIRSDSVHRAGPLRMRDFVSMLPFTDELVLLELTGADVLTALETGVSSWPRLEGRFLQVSGIQFTFDPDRQPGSRILRDCVTIAGQPLDLRRKYKVATKAYLRGGKDGFECLRAAPVLVDGETAPRLATLVQYLLMRIEQLNEQLESEWEKLFQEQQQQQQQQQQYVAGSAQSSSRSSNGTSVQASSSNGSSGHGARHDAMSIRGSNGSSNGTEVSSSRSSSAVAVQEQQWAEAAPEHDQLHSSAALTALSYLQPCTHGLDSLYSYSPEQRQFGIGPHVEGRIVRLEPQPAESASRRG